MSSSAAAEAFAGPTNTLVTALLTDLYQVTMAYAYWKGGRHQEHAVFDVFFRKNPFRGEFSIFAGLGEVLKHVQTFRFKPEEIEYIRGLPAFSDAEEGFFEWLTGLDCSEVRIYAVAEGSVVFPRIPLLRIEGPIGICQLLETTVLNLTNFATLLTTNAARMRLAAGDNKTLLEFGLRRAQGPDGGMSASRYAVLGGFDGSSNCSAGRLFGIAIKGTHAHSFVCSFKGPEDLADRMLDGHDLWSLCWEKRKALGWHATNQGELAAFVSYALAFPSGFLALVDTYDTLKSGTLNFLVVALVLETLGYKAVGIRLDSGDLAYFSREARKMFLDVGEKEHVDFSRLKVVASNDINETVLNSLNEQGHEIDVFGIGTNLVTCQAQPALGMVYKLVQVDGRPVIKLSNELEKVTIPGKKEVFRILGNENVALCDIMVREGEQNPTVGHRIMCRHPFIERKRVYVTPSNVIRLLQPVWNGTDRAPLPSLAEMKEFCQSQLQLLRDDHLRALNPAKYKVSVSDDLYNFIHELWMKNNPIPELQ